MTKRWVWWLIALVPVMGVVTLPASPFLRANYGAVSIERVDGRVWAGEAVVDWPGQSPLPLSWRWSGGLEWAWWVRSEDINIEGRWRLTDRSALQGIRGRVNVQALDMAQWLVVTWPQGALEIDVERVAWSQPDGLWATGQVKWEEASLAGLVNESLGDVVADLSPSTQHAGHTQVEIRSSASGAVAVQGDVLTNGDQYRATITLAPDPSRPDIARFFQSLGSQRDGQVVIERAGQWGVF